MTYLNNNITDQRFHNAEKTWLKVVDLMEEMKACKIAPDGQHLIPVIPRLRVEHSISHTHGCQKRSEGVQRIEVRITIDGNSFALIHQSKGSAAYKLRYSTDSEDLNFTVTSAGISRLMTDFGLHPEQYAATRYKMKPLDTSALGI